MTTNEGKAAYAAARERVPLADRTALFVRIIDECLLAVRTEAMLHTAAGQERPGARRSHHKSMLVPAVCVWGGVCRSLAELRLQTGDEEASQQIAGIVRALGDATTEAEGGEYSECLRAVREARHGLQVLAAHLDAIGELKAAARCRSLAADVWRAVPLAADAAKYSVPSNDAALQAGERSRDLRAVAHWLAPGLAKGCAAANLDGTVIREVGNILGATGGGGPAHLATVWPEQRARIEHLVDLAAQPDGTRAGATADAARGHSRVHGDAFEWIRSGNQTYHFTTDRQRACIKAMFEADGELIHEDVIRDAAGCESADNFRLSHTFRRNGQQLPAWGSIILAGPKRSRMYRLALMPPESPLCTESP